MNNILRDLVLVLFTLTIGLIQSCKKDDSKDPEPITYGTIADIDGNVYKTIQIEIPTGISKSFKTSQNITQIWMAENLKTTKYDNGDPIPNITQNQDWVALTTGAYCNYNNITNNSTTYGQLYNWYAVNTGKLCPTGWHVPTDAEWTTLINYLGGESIAGGKLKEKGTKHWKKTNEGATNEIGFTALPGGIRVYDGLFDMIGNSGYWLSSSEEDESTSYCCFIDSFNSYIKLGTSNKYFGISVRCLNGELPALTVLTTIPATNISPVSATSGGNIVSDIGSSDVTVRGVCWNSSPNPTRQNNKTVDGAGTGSYTSNITNLLPVTTYYVRAYATNSGGTAYGNQISFTTPRSSSISDIIFNPNLTYGSVSDIEGNTYKTIKIGNQVWMAENLRTTKYNDGTTIPLIIDNTSWIGLSTPGYCWYNHDSETYKATYGALYNQYAVDALSNGGKNVCPTGWHVPTDLQWTTLTTYLGGESVAGGKLKEAGTTHWMGNTGGTNETGFTALPGGSRTPSISAFNLVGIGGYWRSSTEFNTSNAWYRSITNNSSSVNRLSNTKLFGFSVRCLMD